MQTTVFVTHPVSQQLESWSALTPQDLLQQLETAWGFSELQITLGAEDILDIDFQNAAGAFLEARLSVLGGKGGYGSLLRIAAAQKKHFNNFDSSRDAMGRRLRDIKNEHRLMQFIKKKQQEQELIEREQKALDELRKQQQMLKPSSREVAALSIDQTYSRQIKQREGALGNLVARAYLAKRTPRVQEESEQPEDTQRRTPTSTVQNIQILKLIHRRTGKGAPKLELNQPSSSSLKVSQTNEGNPSQTIPAKVTSDQPKALSKPSNTDPASVQTLQISGNSIQATAPLHFDPIELEKVASLEQMLQFDPEHLKHELKRLGLKCGGKPEDRAKRLWEVKVNPRCLLDYRFLAKQ